MLRNMHDARFSDIALFDIFAERMRETKVLIPDVVESDRQGSQHPNHTYDYRPGRCQRYVERRHMNKQRKAETTLRAKGG